jgi:hypothetical protein
MTMTTKLPPLDFVAPRIQKFEDTEMGQRCRPRGTAERAVHVKPPMTDAERERQHKFSSHDVAQQAAARRGPLRIHSQEQANAQRIAAQAADTADRGTIDALQARVSSQAATLATQAAMIQELRDRLDGVEGGNSSGEAA